MRTTPLTPPPLDAVVLGNNRRVVLDRLLGRGTQARVYEGWLGEANDIRRPVAVKLFHAFASDEREGVIEALLDSARRAACVVHPNVVAIHEAGVHATQPYIVMEVVRGISLRGLMDNFASRARRMPLGLGLFIALEVADALTAAKTAHGPDGLPLNMVHGELSPREVLLGTTGCVKLMDFEQDRARYASSDVRSISVVAHRSTTLAPEVACGDRPDARSDVFSLGLLLREMLIGPRFSKNVKDSDIVSLTQSGVVEPITFRPQLPREVFEVIERAIAVDAVERYPQASAFAYDLRRIALSLGTGDERIFLKQTLAIELEDELSEITRPAFVTVPRPPTPAEAFHRTPRSWLREVPPGISEDDLEDES